MEPVRPHQNTQTGRASVLLHVSSKSRQSLLKRSFIASNSVSSSSSFPPHRLSLPPALPDDDVIYVGDE